MPCRDQIDIANAVRGKTQKGTCQFLFRHLAPSAADRDPAVLTKDASQGASAEENGTGPILAANTRLLPIMGRDTRDLHLRRASATSELTALAINTALKGT